MRIGPNAIVLALACYAAGCAGGQNTQHAEDATSAANPELPKDVTLSGGDGSSCDQRIVIDAPNESAGVATEYAYLKRKYPGFTRIEQALLFCNKRAADRLKIRTTRGDVLDVYFDIQSFFGKWDR